MLESLPFMCLTCGTPIAANPINGWAGGHNPDPIGVSDPDLDSRRVCDDCNAIYVIPARLGQPVSGTLYDVDGSVLGTFTNTREVTPA